MKAPSLDEAFAALADPTRRAVIAALVQRPHRAGELAALTRMRASALSRHLRVLRRSGLVVDQSVPEDARVIVYRIAPLALSPLRRWLDQLETSWSEQLRAFKAFAEKSAGKADKR